MNLKTEEIKVIAELPYSWEKIKDKTADNSGSYGVCAWHRRHILGACVRH